MSNFNQYKGGNKNSGATRYGNHKVELTAPARVDPPEAAVAKVQSPVSVAADADAARAAVAILSIDDRSLARTAPHAAINGMVDGKPLASAEARVDALDNVPSGQQILADAALPAGSTLPKS